MILKAIYASEDRAAARVKASQVIEKLKEMKLKEATKKIEDGIDETLTYIKNIKPPDYYSEGSIFLLL